MLSAGAFYWWLEWSPKSWIDRTCGAPNWLPITFIPFLVLPALLGALEARRRGRSAAAALVLAVGLVIITAIGCFVAFLYWFGVHKCGE